MLHFEYKIYEPIAKAVSLDELKKLMHLSEGAQYILAHAFSIKESCSKSSKTLIA